MSGQFFIFSYSTCYYIFTFYKKNKQCIIPRKNKHLYLKKFTQCQISNQCENCCCPVSHNFYQISWHMHGALERRQLCYQDFNKNTPIWFDDHICKLFNFVLFYSLFYVGSSSIEEGPQLVLLRLCYACLYQARIDQANFCSIHYLELQTAGC